MVEVLDSVLASPSTSTPPPLIPVSPDNSALDFGGDSDPPEFDLDHPVSEANPLTSESDPMTVGVIYEPETEDMTSDLTADFRRRIHKRLHEPIDVVAPATKKSRPEEVHDPPIEEVPHTLAPHPNTVGSSSVPCQEGGTVGSEPGPS